MLSTNVIPARNLQKSYKSIIDGVKTKKHVVVLTTKNKPQVAIVSLEDLEKIQQINIQHAALGLLQMAIENKKELKSLPADLRQKTNEILYGK